jgi:hypothetical protein
VFPKAVLILSVLLFPATGWCRQDTAPLSAKTLYYQAEADDAKPPVKPAAKPPAAAKPPVANTPAKSSSPSRITAIQSGGAVPAPVVSMVDHLGLRYNLLQFDRKSRKSVAVDPDHVFEQGDCVQLELAPNRSGYLYVFDQGSSGKWEVLLPSALMSDEVNVIKSKEAVKVPANYCFTVQNPAGTEHLFVVLSRNQEDMYSLDRAIRAKSAGPATNMASAKTDKPLSPVMEAANRLDAEIQRMRSGLGSRDLGIEKTGESEKPGEPADAVYVVNTSNVATDRLVTEIQIRHH